MGEGRILLVLGPSTGGMRRHVAALRDGLVQRGWEVDTAGPAGVLDVLGGQEHVVPVPPGWRADRVVRAASSMRRLAPAYDLVHAHGLKAGWVSVAAQRRTPLVVTVHNQVLPGQGGRAEVLLRALERRLPARADAVIATSDALGRDLAPALPPGRLWVIRPVGPPVGPVRPRASVREELGVAQDAPLVVGVGRLHPQKGWLDLVSATGPLRTTWPDVRVVVVGEGPEHAALRQAIVAAELADTMVLAGPRANPADELAAADVVVIPSRWESGPLVVAEALSLGCAVVVTPVGFAPELVVDGVTGLVVPVADPGALSAAIDRLLAGPAEAAALGRAGRQRTKELLDPDELVDQVVSVYRAVLDRA